jgi:hypothetical protein
VSGYIIDAFGVIGSKWTQEQFALKIMKSADPCTDLVKRMLTHIIANDAAPKEVNQLILYTMYQYTATY